MSSADPGTTSSTLLSKLQDWRDGIAWKRFQDQYDPYLKRCCARIGLDESTANDICQETWLEVAKRIRAFEYDPRKGKFRGWLWMICRNKALDHFRSRDAKIGFSFDDRDEIAAQTSAGHPAPENTPALGPEPDDDDAESRFLWLREAREIQEAVQQRIDPKTWEAFWLFGVLCWTVHEVIEFVPIAPTSVYAARTRVLQHLRDEARRRGLPVSDEPV